MEGVEVYLHNSAVDGVAWSASRLAALSLEEPTASTVEEAGICTQRKHVVCTDARDCVLFVGKFAGLLHLMTILRPIGFSIDLILADALLAWGNSASNRN
jgi:hypothetical protein